MKKSQKIYAIVTAKLNSKRVKKKNTRNVFKNSNLLKITYQESIKSKFINNIILLTESKKIANLGKKIGYKIPYLRSKKLAQKKSNIFTVVDYIKRNISFINNSDLILLLQLTSPLRKFNDINNCIKLKKLYNFSSIISVVKSRKKVKYPIEAVSSKKKLKVFIITPKKKLEYLKNFNNKFHFGFNGAIFLTEVKNLLKNQTFYSGKIGCYVMSEKKSLDIDTNADFFKLKKIFKCK